MTDYTSKVISIADSRIKSYHSVEVTFTDDGPLAFAFITFKDWKIYIFLANNFREYLTEIIGKYEIQMPIEKIEDLFLKFMVTHEYGHFSICPYDYYNYDKIVRVMHRYIEPRLLSKIRIKEVCANIGNMFMDTIVNAEMSRQYDDYNQGMLLFYLISHLYDRKKSKSFFKFFHRIPKCITSFMQSNMALCNIKRDEANQLNKFYSLLYGCSHRTLFVIINIFIRDKKETEKVMAGKGTPSTTLKMIDKSLWEIMVEEYTKIIFPLIKDEGKDKFSNSFTKNEGKGNGQSQDKPKNSGNDGKEEEKKPDKSNDGKEEEKKPDKSNDGKEEEKKPDKSNDGKDQKPEKKDSESSKEEKEDNKSPLEKILENIAKEQSSHHYIEMKIEDYIRLDNYYKGLAKPLKILSDIETKKKSHSYNVRIGCEEISPVDFSPKNIEWSATRMLDNKVHIFQKPDKLEISNEIQIERSQKGFPDMCFIIDSSMSMEFEPYEQTGDYHYAVLAVYNIIEYLARNNLLSLLNFSAINFSKETIYSGWHPYTHLDKVKRALLKYQGDFTTLDSKILKQVAEERKDNFILFILTDSGFNKKEIAIEVGDTLIDIANGGYASVFHFQMGYDLNGFSHRLKRNNIPVLEISSAEDFMHLSLQFTKELYGKVI